MALVTCLVTSRKCGCLVIGPRDKALENSKSALIRHGVQHEVFGIEEMRKRYPGLEFPSNYEFVLDKSGGILMADKVLNAFQVQIQQAFFQLQKAAIYKHLLAGSSICHIK